MKLRGQQDCIPFRRLQGEVTLSLSGLGDALSCDLFISLF